MNKVLVFDIGSTNFRYALMNEEGKFLTKVFFEKTPSNKKEFLDKIIKTYKHFKTDTVAMSIASAIKDNKIIEKFETYDKKIIKNINIYQILSKIGCKKIFVENDCNSSVLGEVFFGYGKNKKSVVYVTISSGIGAGIFENGRLIRGEDGFAGEVGYIPPFRKKLEDLGIKSWEYLCSGKTVHLSANKFLKKDIFKDAQDFFSTARKTKDKKILEFVELVHEHNARGFATITNFFNPSIIIVGGGVILNNRWLIKEIKTRMKKYLEVPQPAIKITRLKEKVGLYGSLALTKYLSK